MGIILRITMTKFEVLFGIKEQEIKKYCVLLPILPKGILNYFEINKLSGGKLYGSASNDYLTLIRTGIGPAFVGDAVLYLKETACEKIILFGSCGLTAQKDNLGIGSLVAPFKCYSQESFSEMLSSHKLKRRVFYPHKGLLQDFLGFSCNSKIQRVTSATISSLKIEEKMTNAFLEQRIEVVDMECSAFFAASSYSGLPAIALFYITDILREKPFYTDLDAALENKLISSMRSGARRILEFTKRL